MIRRRNGLYLVHTKAFYPQGVYRLLTGGIKPGEPLLEALAREAQEETSLTLRIERFFRRLALPLYLGGTVAALYFLPVHHGGGKRRAAR